MISWNQILQGDNLPYLLQLRGDVWEYTVLAGKNFKNEKTDHPTQKPESLTTDILKAFCNKESMRYSSNVLDPYSGSGTTAVCCESLNLQGHQVNWIALELEQRWVKEGNERVESLKNNWFNGDIFANQ